MNAPYRGYLPIASATLLIIFWTLFAVLLPMQEAYLNWVLNENWVWVNAIGFVGSLLGVFAFISIYSFGRLHSLFDNLALGAAISGAVILSGILFFEAFILKGIALQAPEIVRIGEGFYIYPSFYYANLSGGILTTLGVVGLSYRMIKTAVFRRWKLIVLSIGTLLFTLVVIDPNLRLAGLVLYATGLISVGAEMLGKDGSGD